MTFFSAKKKQCTISRETNEDCFLKNNNKAQNYPPRATFKVQHCHFQRSKNNEPCLSTHASNLLLRTDSHPSRYLVFTAEKRTAAVIAHPPSGKGAGRASSAEEKQITSCCLCLLPKPKKEKKKKKKSSYYRRNPGEIDALF